MPVRRPLPVPAVLRLLALFVACLLATAACVERSDTATVRSTLPGAGSAARSLPGLTPEGGSVRTSVAGLGQDTGEADAGDPGPDPALAAADRPRDVLLVGDSVLVLVADDVARRMDATLYVDGADCRRLDRSVSGPCGGVPGGAEVSDGVRAVRDAVEALADRGTVPDAAVFILANNSSITRTDLEAAMEATGAIPHVWWVNTRISGFGRQDPNNRLLDALAEADPRAGVVDWYSASADQAWLADGVHPNEAGQAGMARLIHDRLLCGCT